MNFTTTAINFPTSINEFQSPDLFNFTEEECNFDSLPLPSFMSNSIDDVFASLLAPEPISLEIPPTINLSAIPCTSQAKSSSVRKSSPHLPEGVLSRRERNRQAAERCRKKKIQEIETLREENEKLKRMQAMLIRENQMLKERLQSIFQP